jgi:glycopeptide antibiotics resistance protein
MKNIIGFLQLKKQRNQMKRLMNKMPNIIYIIGTSLMISVMSSCTSRSGKITPYNIYRAKQLYSNVIMPARISPSLDIYQIGDTVRVNTETKVISNGLTNVYTVVLVSKIPK